MSLVTAPSLECPHLPCWNFRLFHLVAAGQLVQRLKDFNTAKFKVIHEMEQQLPVALFEYEWHVCGKGKDRAKYVPLTHLERLVPWMFGLLFVGLAAYSLFATPDKKPEPAPNMRVIQAAPDTQHE